MRPAPRLVRACPGARRPAARAHRRPAGAEAPDRRRGRAARARQGRGRDRGRRRGHGRRRRICPISPSVLPEVLRPGDDILIDDGLVRLRVEAVETGRVQRDRRGRRRGRGTGKGVNVPGVPLPIPSLTEKDVADLEFALGLDVDFVALSFVRSANDVRQLRELLHEAGSHRAGHREDREGGGARRPERDPQPLRRGHGRPRRPRRRDRPGRGAARPEADPPAPRSSAGSRRSRRRRCSSR